MKSMAGKVILWRGRLPPEMIRARRGARYLVITMNKLRFAKRRCHAEHVPSPIARIDLLLLTLIRVRGSHGCRPGEKIGLRLEDHRESPFTQLRREP